MSASIIVLVEQLKGNIPEISYEMLGAARKIADASGGKVYALIAGKGSSALATNLGAADVSLVLEDSSADVITDEVLIEALKQVINDKQASLVFVGCTNISFGVGTRLALRSGIPFINWVKDIKTAEGEMVVTSALFGEKF
jgi:electron transfer flavoprotein alpha subunit